MKTLISAASGALADLKLKDGDQVHFGDYVRPAERGMGGGLEMARGFGWFRGFWDF